MWNRFSVSLSSCEESINLFDTLWSSIGKIDQSPAGFFTSDLEERSNEEIRNEYQRAVTEDRCDSICSSLCIIHLFVQRLAEEERSSKHSFVLPSINATHYYTFDCRWFTPHPQSIGRKEDDFDLYIKGKHLFISSDIQMMEHPNKSIGDLLRDIRLVETKHNELVDEYFQISKPIVEKKLGREKSIDWCFSRRTSEGSIEEFERGSNSTASQCLSSIFNSIGIRDEMHSSGKVWRTRWSSPWKLLIDGIALFRLKLTNLICLLEEHGVRLNEDEEDEEENENEISSCDEGIDDQSISVHDLSSKISSHDNSTIDDVFWWIKFRFTTDVEKDSPRILLKE